MDSKGVGQGGATSTMSRVLVLEKRSADAERLLRRLQTEDQDIELKMVYEQEEFMREARTGGFSVVVSPYELEDWSGLEALLELRREGNEAALVLYGPVLREYEPPKCKATGVKGGVVSAELSQLPMAVQKALAEKQLRDSNTQVRRALMETESRNRELTENSLYGVFRATQSGGILSANPAMLQMLAYPSLEMLETSSLPREIFRFPAQYNKLLASCRENGLVPSAECEWRRRDGGFISVKLHLRHVALNGRSELEGIVEDVTELRALEHQLRQAQKFELIGQLAGGIAHDFNNVVGAILGWSELGFEESQTHPRIAERFARIREQADRAAALTRELLAFARQQTLQPRAVDLNDVIKTFTVFLAKVIGSDIEMKVMTGELNAVLADPTQMEQVLMNLCLNARDAMPDGGCLTIATEMVELDEAYCRYNPGVTPGRYAVLAVSDTGFGMNPETRDRIFEPFFTTKARGKGSGMGLAVAYGIVKQHGGFIHVYSEVGEGTLFRVYLPATNGAQMNKMCQVREVSPAQNLQGSETILIAEDHHSIREMVRQSMASLGYTVLTATNGEEAIEACENEAPALAILDVVMPKLGGMAAAAKLKERYPALPVLFTSGYSENAGMNRSQFTKTDYLQKPYSPTSLARAIRRMLDLETNTSD
ncbi:MAG TPA: response regulator [Dongiaceae bacterium]|nr:response regulator [Dongiaceae bacterium]